MGSGKEAMQEAVAKSGLDRYRRWQPTSTGNCHADCPMIEVVGSRPHCTIMRTPAPIGRDCAVARIAVALKTDQHQDELASHRTEIKELHERHAHASHAHSPTGWCCPKCGCVYAPIVLECARCNALLRPGGWR